MGKCRAKNKPCRSGSRCPGVSGASSLSVPTTSPRNAGNSINPVNSPSAQVSAPQGRGAKAEASGLAFMQKVIPSGWSLVETGKNSKFSDIHMLNDKGETKGFLEVKQLPSAAGGQLVVEKVGDKFTTSNWDNPHSPKLLALVNKHQLSDIANKSVIPVTDEEDRVVWNWMYSHWATKNVQGFYFTDSDNSYEKLVPLNEVENHVSLILNKPRNKRSGSGDLNKTDYPVVMDHFSYLLGKDKFNVRQDGKQIFIKPAVIPNLYQQVGDRVFFLSTESKLILPGEFRIKKTASTNNPNVIIRLKLKGKKESTSSADVQRFFKYIR